MRCIEETHGCSIQDQFFSSLLLLADSDYLVIKSIKTAVSCRNKQVFSSVTTGIFTSFVKDETTPGNYYYDLILVLSILLWACTAASLPDT